MKEEIDAGVVFLTNLVKRRSCLGREKIEEFGEKLTGVLQHSYQGHWYPANPSKGQAYRCIRINGSQRRDPVLLLACQKCNVDYSQLQLPQEMTLWIDPQEVWCRSGEGSQPFTVACFDKDSETGRGGDGAGVCRDSDQSLPESSSEGTSDEEEQPVSVTASQKSLEWFRHNTCQVPILLDSPLPWPPYSPKLLPVTAFVSSTPLLSRCLLPTVPRPPPGLLLPLWGPPLPRTRKRRK
ncbi:maternal B9.15 protein-like [Mobula hypostoma]|uniref:maternal B9.15 protein-like n=1 Tax=Mobula hypostoma TaxID=723540 RepID=UPI002FC3486A